MKKITYCFLTLLLVIGCSSPQETSKRLVDYVDPFIGTAGHGHTIPGALLPFGMVQLSPDNEKRGWDWCSGYHASDSIIIGFSHTHLSGTGCGDLQDVLVMPFVQTPKADTTAKGGNFIYQFKSHFSHSNEVATPGYYSVDLDGPKVKVELTATQRAGFHKYTYGKNDTARIVIDLASKGGWDKQIDTYISQLGDSSLTGYQFTNGWAANQKVYFIAKFSQPIKSLILSKEGELTTGLKEIKGLSAKAIVEFGILGDKPVLVKVGISSSSVEGATKNLSAEIKGWDFDATRTAAADAWEKILSKFTVESVDKNLMKTFYTAVYHAFTAPNLYSDVDGNYTGMDGKVHQAKDFNNFYTLSLWDTFRALHPLLTLTDDKLVADIINAMLSQYRESGLLPVWSLWGNETNCMPGYHAIPVITDAYLKGIKGFDANEAFEAMKKSAMQNIRNTDLYRKYGYIPHDQKLESVSTTLEYAYDDWCIAQFAKALGKTDDYNVFLKRSQNFWNIADTTIGFMRPRNTDKSWMTPFDPALIKHGNGFTEGNAWQYSWFVPQDIAGLKKIMGGDKKFTEKLDQLFTTKSTTEVAIIDVSGLVGQYAQGNEPSHHVAYLYNYAGEPWKTQSRIAMLRDSMYKSTRDGLCGNDDCGQMSAWYIFSSMGFYPVNPANGIYAIGTPAFDKLTMNMGNGKTFTVTASGVSKENVYIQSAKLNGAAYEKSFITHKDILAGGTLEFVMGNKPNTSWGSKTENWPPVN
jgi:predicted alpha-1,2-mannosidase